MITREYTERENIFVFDDTPNSHDYNPSGLDELFKFEEEHFWFNARKSKILDVFEQFSHRSENIIEIGAGTGNVTRHLMKNGYSNISAGEMHRNGLDYAKSYGLTKLYQFDLLNPPFENEFDSIGMFDVIEHIEEDDKVIESVKKMLKKDGKVYITVPAHNWLWSMDDEIACHKKRYNMNELLSLLKKNDFDILYSKYFFISIVPLLLLRRLINPANGKPLKTSGSLKINPIVNSFLRKICRFENKFSKLLPNMFGGSIVVVAKAKK